MRDHTSALKHLQTVFGLESINGRIDAANDLTECLDMDRLARNDPAKPITMPAINPEDYPYTNAACKGGGFRTTAIDPITQYANENPGAFRKGEDLRDSTDVYLQGIHDFYEANRG